jgi:putative redox protein
MKAELIWKEKMHLAIQIDGFTIEADSGPPFGEGKHPTPKQLLLSSMASCTSMDVISLLKKYKQEFTSFAVTAEAPTATTMPPVFTECVFTFRVEGSVDPLKLNEAIHLSLSKYCPVNAMVSKVVPISWIGVVNGIESGEGRAEFTI